MYKAVFSDFDGTLLTSQHTISPRTVAAIKRLTENGIPFVPISARSPLGILPYWKQLETNNVLVAFSGALILNQYLEPIYSVQIDPKDILDINTVLADHPLLGVNYYTNNDCHAREVENKWVIYERSVTKIEIHPFDEVATRSPHKIQIIGEAQEIIEIEIILKEKFPYLSICRSHANFLEVMHKSATKGSAVRFLEDYFGVQTHEVIAFGDNFNDKEMFDVAGWSVCPNNAKEEIQNMCDEVIGNNNDFSVIKYVEDYYKKIK